MRRHGEGDSAVTTARQRQERRDDGLCPRCGGPVDETPEINTLTHAPLRRDGQVVIVRTCANDCGYSYRPPAR